MKRQSAVTNDGHPTNHVSNQHSNSIRFSYTAIARSFPATLATDHATAATVLLTAASLCMFCVSASSQVIVARVMPGNNDTAVHRNFGSGPMNPSAGVHNEEPDGTQFCCEYAALDPDTYPIQTPRHALEPPLPGALVWVNTFWEEVMPDPIQDPWIVSLDFGVQRVFAEERSGEVDPILRTGRRRF